MPKARGWCLAALCAGLVGCTNIPDSHLDPAGAIQDPDAALVVAHAMYWSVMKAHHPEIPPGSIDSWKRDCEVTLERDVWDIWCPAGGRYADRDILGGGLRIKIAKSGQLLFMALYQ